MHYQHVIALAQIRHEEHQEYARQASRTSRRHRSRRWRRLRLVGRYRAVLGSRRATSADASDNASAIAS
jgi:hypothetical protein